MNIDWNRIEFAVADRRVDDRLRHDLTPLAGLCLAFYIAHKIVADEFVELFACIELHHGWRIAADDAVDPRSTGIRAPGNGIIDPGAAAFCVLVGEHSDGGGLAGRCPPMEYFRLLSESSGARNQGNRKGIRGNACFQAHGFLPEALLSIFVIDYILLYVG